MLVDLTPEALAYLLAREAARTAGPVPTGGKGGAHMAAARADMAWQGIGCRVRVEGAPSPPLTPDELVDLATGVFL